MSDDEFKEIIISKLDRIANLLEMNEKREIENLKVRLLGRSKIKKEIYDLINGERTVQEIANLLKIAQPNISKAIADLVDGNLIGKKTKGKFVIYYKKYEG